MADKSKIAEMLEHLVNNEAEKAEELFHEYVVEKSREIYEDLIESEIEEASAEDEEDEDEDLEEASDKEEDDEEDLEEDFDVVEADSTDDFVSDSEEEDEDEEGEENPFGDEEGEEDHDEGAEATKGDIEELKMSIEDHFAELEAAFKELAAGEEAEEHDHPGIHDMGGPDVGDENLDDSFELETVREYTEKIGGATYDKFAKGGDNGQNTKSPVAGKNDMGGTTANIAKGGEGGGSESGLTKNKPQDMNTGNVNVVGGTKTSSFYSKDGKGHGAEKAGAKESGTNTTSVFRK
jgi:hypothetical protein